MPEVISLDYSELGFYALQPKEPYCFRKQIHLRIYFSGEFKCFKRAPFSIQQELNLESENLNSKWYPLDYLSLIELICENAIGSVLAYITGLLWRPNETMNVKIFQKLKVLCKSNGRSIFFKNTAVYYVS